MPSRMDGSKPPGWTGFPPNLDIPEVEILSDSETEPDYFNREIANFIDNEYAIFSGHARPPAWVRHYHDEGERRIQEAISEEDDREYMHLVNRLRRTTRQINEITNSGIFDENITDLINMRTNLRQRVAQLRMNPRINRTNARAFRRYVRDQRR